MVECWCLKGGKHRRHSDRESQSEDRASLNGGTPALVCSCISGDYAGSGALPMVHRPKVERG
jgi:hypothetical protein